MRSRPMPRCDGPASKPAVGACSFDFGWGFRRLRICDQTGVMGKVTLQTIADRVGVSRMTVSNAFSRPDQLSAELRDKIMAAADELGYVGPDPAARVHSPRAPPARSACSSPTR